MKKRLFLPLGLAILLTSCGNTGENVETSTNKDTTAQQPQPEPELVVGFEADWEHFKTSVADNNWDDFSTFVGSDVSDPEGLLTMLQEEWVLTPLLEANYEDLTLSDYNGLPVKEFVAEVEGSDDEGNIYESAVFLYFEESSTGLKLVNVLMAG